MDIKRAKELTSQLYNLIERDEVSEFNKISEDLKNEIRVKIMAILNELDIRLGEIIDFEHKKL